MKVQKHGGRAHSDGSSDLAGVVSKASMRAEMIGWLSRDG